jgi:hypothetical protein
VFSFLLYLMFLTDLLTPRGWPMWWRSWSWGLFPSRSKVQYLMGAVHRIGVYSAGVGSKGPAL